MLEKFESIDKMPVITGRFRSIGWKAENLLSILNQIKLLASIHLCYPTSQFLAVRWLSLRFKYILVEVLSLLIDLYLYCPRSVSKQDLHHVALCIKPPSVICCPTCYQTSQCCGILYTATSINPMSIFCFHDSYYTHFGSTKQVVL